jgi:hypothetical protein
VVGIVDNSNGEVDSTELAAVSLGNSLLCKYVFRNRIFHCNTPMAAQNRWQTKH